MNNNNLLVRDIHPIAPILFENHHLSGEGENMMVQRLIILFVGVGQLNRVQGRGWQDKF